MGGPAAVELGAGGAVAARNLGGRERAGQSPDGDLTE